MSGGLGITPRLALGRRQSAVAPWSPAVLLTGAAHTATEIEPGVIGSKNITTNANRIYCAAATAGATGGTLWSGWINGTAATLKAKASQSAAALVVSVDGGAYANAADSSYTYTLFTGLADTLHHVCIKIGAAFGNDNVYFDRTQGNILTITGADPYCLLASDWVYPGVSNALSVAAGMTRDNAANYAPARTKYNILANTSNCGAARVRGNFTRLIVASNGTSGFSAVYVSVDGAAPTKHVLPLTPGTGGYAHQITGLSGVHTYTVWTDLPGIVFSVAGDGPHVDIGAKRQMHQFGDSITVGGGPSIVMGEVDVLRVGAALGFAGLTAAVGGQTVQQIDTSLTTYLAALTVTSDDVAIMAGGRNNAGGAFDATEIAAYQSIISKLVTKGYGKIICRGILPAGDHSTTWSAENGSIASIVAGVGNANVVFCDVSGLGTYTTQDGTHPDAAGYAVIAAYVEPLYRAILGL